MHFHTSIMTKRFKAEIRAMEGQSHESRSTRQLTTFRCPICHFEAHSKLFFESSTSLNAHLSFYHASEYKKIVGSIKKRKGQ